MKKEDLYRLLDPRALVIEIVKNHPQYKNEEQVKLFIRRYRNRPRLICQALEEKSQ